MAIPFTQFMRPDGRQVPAEIERSVEIERKAQEIISAGFRFECEHLSTGHASLTIADPVQGEDVAIRVVTNGPKVEAAVDDMINEFHAKLKKVGVTHAPRSDQSACPE